MSGKSRMQRKLFAVKIESIRTENEILIWFLKLQKFAEADWTERSRTNRSERRWTRGTGKEIGRGIGKRKGIELLQRVRPLQIKGLSFTILFSNILVTFPPLIEEVMLAALLPRRVARGAGTREATAEGGTRTSTDLAHRPVIKGLEEIGVEMVPGRGSGKGREILLDELDPRAAALITVLLLQGVAVDLLSQRRGAGSEAGKGRGTVGMCTDLRHHLRRLDVALQRQETGTGTADGQTAGTEIEGAAEGRPGAGTGVETGRMSRGGD